MWTPSYPPKSTENVCRNMVPNYTLKYSLTHHEPSSVKFSPDGKYLASAGGDKTIKIWKVEDGTLEKTLEGHTKEINDVAWSSDSEQLVSASDDKTLIIWDVFGISCEYYRTERTLEGHDSKMFCCNFDPQGYCVASGSVDGSLVIWDIASNPAVISKRQAHTDTVSAVEYNRDGRLLVTSSYDGLCRVWDSKIPGLWMYTLLDESVQIGQIPPAIWFAKFLSNEKYILAGSSDNTLKLYDFATETCEKSYKGHKSEKLRTSGDFSETGGETWVVNGSEDNLVYIWHLQTEAIVQKLEGHTDAVLSAACYPELNMIVTAGNDDAIKVWEWIGD